ncbi:MAG: hypothetical protein VB115_14390 [Christensenellaceae bacterium]|nr:hypothetical protein [Christensenellaceae bacterium]
MIEDLKKGDIVWRRTQRGDWYKVMVWKVLKKWVHVKPVSETEGEHLGKCGKTTRNHLFRESPPESYFERKKIRDMEYNIELARLKKELEIQDEIFRWLKDGCSRAEIIEALDKMGLDARPYL